MKNTHSTPAGVTIVVEKTEQIRGGTRPLAVALGALGMILCAGCRQDTRMSLQQFIEAEPVPLVASSQPAGAAIQPWAPGPYRVGPGDVLRIRIAGLEPTGPTAEAIPTYRVTEKGEVILPSVGAVVVNGMTLDEVETTIQAAYSPKYIKETQVTAQVESYRLVNVIVVGDTFRFSSSGSQIVELRRDRTSVLQAILASGGASEFGGRVTHVPAKAPGQVTVYEMNNQEHLARAARIGTVEEGDLLIVDSRANDSIYVYGLVNTPGAIPVGRAAMLSVMQAIGAAGGTRHEFEPREATLMRRRADGSLARVKIDLDRIKQGIDPDLALAAGDVLVLPHNTATRIEEYIARYFQPRIGVGIDTTYNPWTLYYLQKNAEMTDRGIFDSIAGQIPGVLPNMIMNRLPAAKPVRP